MLEPGAGLYDDLPELELLPSLDEWGERADAGLPCSGSMLSSAAEQLRWSLSIAAQRLPVLGRARKGFVQLALVAAIANRVCPGAARRALGTYFERNTPCAVREDVRRTFLRTGLVSVDQLCSWMCSTLYIKGLVEKAAIGVRSSVSLMHEHSVAVLYKHMAQRIVILVERTERGMPVIDSLTELLTAAVAHETRRLDKDASRLASVPIRSDEEVMRNELLANTSVLTSRNVVECVNARVKQILLCVVEMASERWHDALPDKLFRQWQAPIGQSLTCRHVAAILKALLARCIEIHSLSRDPLATNHACSLAGEQLRLYANLVTRQRGFARALEDTRDDLGTLCHYLRSDTGMAAAVPAESLATFMLDPDMFPDTREAPLAL